MQAISRREIRKYKIGGLENDERNEVIDLNGVIYVISHKFVSMLRDTFIDWGTFLEVYDNGTNNELLVNQAVKLLNIGQIDKINENIIPLLDKIYKLPAESHMYAMIRQYMIYEPVTIIVYSIYIYFKHHYESLIKHYVTERNKYIEKHKTKDTPNDLVALSDYWRQLNLQYKLDTSSLLLTFINPPNNINPYLYLEIEGVPASIKLIEAFSKFKYTGFCPRVPHVRLYDLLQFPLSSLINAIMAIDKSYKPIDYQSMEKEIEKIISEMPMRPETHDKYERKDPPIKLQKNELIKWYVEEILELRKSLISDGKLMEEYYNTQAKIFTRVLAVLKSTF